MSLPAPNLDDLRFQRDLVDEARRRIIRYCPEWTDYNLSDPGITLIEMFAWMTELLVYRLNRVPEKNYVKFLDVLGVQLQPANSARTELTFWLSAPFPITPEDDTVAIVPQGTEVATRRTEEDEEIIFTTDEKLAIVPPALVQVRREGDVNKNYLPRLGLEAVHAFTPNRPRVGDMFYLGFDGAQDMALVLKNGEVWVLFRKIDQDAPPLGVRVAHPGRGLSDPVKVVGWEGKRCLGAWNVRPGIPDVLFGAWEPGPLRLRWRLPGAEPQEKQIVVEQGVARFVLHK